MRVLTIGHSTRTIDAFLALLDAHGVERLVDVRSYPGSRRYPQFGREALGAALDAAGIHYRHVRDLGGRRRARPDSRHTAWRHEAFRGYADHMETEPFRSALEVLLEEAATGVTAIMCAEALWWQCHRRLIADALVARGVEVWHIMDAATLAPHELTPFARLEGSTVTYPGLLGN